MDWIDVKKQKPENGPILFIAKPGVTSEITGFYDAENKLIILEKTTMSLDHIKYFIQIPKSPKGCLV